MTASEAPSPPVVWITGLSGAGKTRLARRLLERLRPSYANLVNVDGDAIREICGNDLGYSEDERVKNAYRLSRLCKFLNEQDIIVLCSTMSLYPEIWTWNRKNIPHLLEVYLKVSLEVLSHRDQKGLYSGVAKASAKNVVGLDMEFNEPPSPHLILKNETEEDLEVNLNTLERAVKKAMGS